MGVLLKSFCITDKGKVRKINQDSVGVFKNQNQQLLAVVADGMGGHQAGEIASHLVIDYLEENWKKNDAYLSEEQAIKWLKEHIKEINNEIFNKGQAEKDCKGMGTTVVAAICEDNFITIAHVGDSRGYLYHENKLIQVTEDDSLVNELVKSGQITEEDAKFHPRKNVLLKALGTELNQEAFVKSIPFKPNDKLMLCSDGLSNKIDYPVLEGNLNHDNLKELSESLVSMANEYGGEDNISIVFVHHVEEAGVLEC